MALDELKKRGMEDCFTLLHFHLGSQITNIRQVKAALNEAARVYTELVGRGAGLKYMDVGGGLGVDYDGSQTNFESSMNYTLEEYARDVVYTIQTVCDEANVAASEYHFGKRPRDFGVSQCAGFWRAGSFAAGREHVRSRTGSAGRRRTGPARSVSELQRRESAKRTGILPRRADVIDTVMTLFNTGYVSLEQRCLAENIYFALCHQDLADYGNDGLCSGRTGTTRQVVVRQLLLQLLAVSVVSGFMGDQAIVSRDADSSAGQPTDAHAVLSDITCDSDGKIDQFIDRRDVRRTLMLHEYDGSPTTLESF